MTTVKRIQISEADVQRLAARRVAEQKEKLPLRRAAAGIGGLHMGDKKLSLPKDCGSSMDAFLDQLIEFWHVNHGEVIDEQKHVPAENASIRDQFSGDHDPQNVGTLGSVYQNESARLASDRVTTILRPSRTALAWQIRRQPGRMAADAAGTHLASVGEVIRTLVDPETNAELVTLQFRLAGRTRLRITLLPSSCADVDIFDAPGGTPIIRITAGSPEVKVDLGTQDINDDLICRHFVPVQRESQD
jgi:hypothetical protein